MLTQGAAAALSASTPPSALAAAAAAGKTASPLRAAPTSGSKGARGAEDEEDGFEKCAICTYPLNDLAVLPCQNMHARLRTPSRAPL